MTIRISTVSPVPRHARLAACLAAALGLTLSAAHAGDAPPARTPLAQGRMAPAFELPSYLRGNASKLHAAPVQTTSPSGPTPHAVISCNDDGTPAPGTLRGAVATAMSGDVIDLSALACSTITLGGSAIEVDQPSLYFQGPIAGPSHLTIDGGNQSAVFYHFGAGTLGFSNLTIANGYYVSASLPNGGCIYSQASVYLLGSVVSHCTLESSSSSIPALGAGVYAAGNLELFASTITDSHAFAVNGANSYGGGAYVKGYFQSLYSTISNNTAFALGGAHGFGGGVRSYSNVAIENSTISGNRADTIGGVDLFSFGAYTATIINSTISSNIGTLQYGGLWTNIPVTLMSSTVAFNHSSYGSLGTSAGVYSRASLTLHSSIIADNAGPTGPSDLGGTGAISVGSANNLVTSSTINPPFGTIFDCPQLEPLANNGGFNGGYTRTHALKHTSPAIDQGDAGILTFDQRGAPRTAGPQADIGSVEWQPGETDDRISVSGFDGLCDQ